MFRTLEYLSPKTLLLFRRQTPPQLRPPNNHLSQPPPPSTTVLAFPYHRKRKQVVMRVRNKVSENQEMDAATAMKYKPPPEFEEVEKDPLIELNLTDSTELWLVQWPINQAPDFNGKEVSLNLNAERVLGSFKGSSGKSYDVVTYESLEGDTTVFLPTASESKIVGKISKHVSLVHYAEPSEYAKDSSLSLKQMAQRAATSLTNSANRFATPSMKSKSSRAVSGYTSSMYTGRDKTLMSGAAERSKPSKRRQVDDPTRSLDQSLQDAGRGHSGVTSTGPDDSRQTKSKRQKKSKD